MQKLFVCVFIFSSIWVLQGCGDSPKSKLDELESMRERWGKLELSDYEYVAGYNCYCGATGPFTLKFSDNMLDTIYFTDREETEIEYSTLLELTEDLIIESLFQRIEENIKRDPHSFSVKYDQHYFFPNEAYFDFDKFAIDEEIGYYIRDFTFQ